MAIIAADAGIVEAARAIEFVLTFFERQPDAGVFVLGNAAALSCPGDSGRAGLPGRHKAVFTGASGDAFFIFLDAAGVISRTQNEELGGKSPSIHRFATTPIMDEIAIKTGKPGCRMSGLEKKADFKTLIKRQNTPLFRLLIFG